MPHVIVLLAIGLATGVLAGMLGAGGGFATVVLLLAAGVSVHEAVGTSLLYTVLIGAWGAAVHLRHGSASIWLAVALGLPSMGTAVVGANLADGMDEHVLTGTFAAITVVVALLFLMGPESRRPRRNADPPPISGAQVGLATSIEPTVRLVIATALGGAAIGVMKGVFGVGGGFLLVPFMVLVLHIPEHMAIGSSLLAIMLGSVAGGLRHLALGNVALDELVLLLPGGLIGSFAGAMVVRRMSPRKIRWAFAAVLLSSAAYLAWHTISG